DARRQRAPAPRRHVSDALSVEHHLPRGDVEQSENGAADRGLAATGFADQCQRFRLVNAERHTVDRVDPQPAGSQQAAAQGEMLLEIVDFEQDRAHAATVALAAKWPGAEWAGAFPPRAGAPGRPRARANAQRLAKTQPAMRWLRLGTAPGISASLVCAAPSEEPSLGTALSRPRV